MKKYIHTKTGKPYSLIGKTMFKDNGVWCKDLILYKAEYDNPDGQYFVRTEEDFNENFKEKNMVFVEEALLSEKMAQQFFEKGYRGAKCEVYDGSRPYDTITQQCAIRYLREVHKLNVEVYRTACGYVYCIVKIPSGTDLHFDEENGDDLPSGTWTTHEKAVDAALKYSLENLI